MKLNLIPLSNLIIIVLLGISCKDPKPQVVLKSPTRVSYGSDSLQLTEEQYFDKVLGALVGSAIGDAMGASTEMWQRRAIALKYGYITGLTPAVREQSPEGTWEHNLMAGSTTDDTRWKYLMVQYFDQYPNQLYPANFSKFITDYYQSVAGTLSDSKALADPDVLDDKMEKIDWIKEWARVAIAYQDGPEAYQKAQNRFYGGEMSCAGQLYTPMFGLISQSPDEAYEMAYDHAIFDIGYAKDISSLVSAMTHMALRTQNMDSLLNVATFVDPYGYQDSRLVGRIAYSIADASVKNVLGIKQLTLIDSLIAKDSIRFRIPEGFPGTPTDWARQEMVNEILEKDQKAIAFHAGEIWQILVTALQFGAGDFEKTMQFIVNYGRDNDTVAAVAGMILGTKDGFARLPVNLRTEVLQVNKEVLDIDLEELARKIVAQRY